MESIDSLLDREFPKTLDVESDAVMETLARLRSRLVSVLPNDTTVDLDLWMNAATLHVYVPNDGHYQRTCTVGKK